MIITRTPFRISFAGGGSDIETFYHLEPGVVLSTAINKYMYISVMESFGNTFRISYSRTELKESVEEIEHPIVRECLQQMNLRSGLEIVSMADLPAATGMGSSSSFTVGLLHALHAFQSRLATSESLAAQACQVEIELLKEPIGKQDQYIAAYGGLQFIRFQPDGSVCVDPVVCRPETKRELNRRLIVFYTGKTRSARTVLERQRANAGNHTASVRKMCDIAHQMRDTLTLGRDLNAFGELLHQSWEIKRSLESTISNPCIDQYYERGLRAGALGGKLLGAGGSGFLLFFCEPHLQDGLRRELAELAEMPFRFEPEGSKVIHVGNDRW